MDPNKELRDRIQDLVPLASCEEEPVREQVRRPVSPPTNAVKGSTIDEGFASLPRTPLSDEDDDKVKLRERVDKVAASKKLNDMLSYFM